MEYYSKPIRNKPGAIVDFCPICKTPITLKKEGVHQDNCWCSTAQSIIYFSPSFSDKDFEQLVMMLEATNGGYY